VAPDHIGKKTRVAAFDLEPPASSACLSGELAPGSVVIGGD
jgi:hypothetical protein